MKKNTTRGWYTFEDGYSVWKSGMDRVEKSVEISKHGKVVKFEPTN